MLKVDVLLIALTSPIKIGIYREGVLIQSIESEEKSSDVLPLLFKENTTFRNRCILF